MTWEERADLAEAMVAPACAFAGLVHDGDRAGVKAFLARYGLDDDAPMETKALFVVLAAMVPVRESSQADLLAWVGGGPVSVLPGCRSREEEPEDELEPEGYTVREMKAAAAKSMRLKRDGKEVPAEVREVALAYRRRGKRLRDLRGADPRPEATRADHVSAA